MEKPPQQDKPYHPYKEQVDNFLKWAGLNGDSDADVWGVIIGLVLSALFLLGMVIAAIVA